MRKGFLFSIVVLASFCASALATGGDMGVGTEPLTDGSVAYPYLIEDLADFDEFAGDSSYWATGVRTKLMTDIDLSGRTYRTAVVAKDTDGSTFQFDGPVFKGKFNGNGFRILNLKIDTSGNDKCYLGLFGKIEGKWTVVKNLNIENYTIIPGRYAGNIGSIAGYNNLSVVKNCFSKGSISYNWTWEVGGLIGRNRGTLEHCISAGSINGGSSLGGLVGSNEGEIIYCSSIGNVNGDSSNVGGLVGNNSGIIEQCLSPAEVNGGAYVGGLVGWNYEGSITRCHSSGSVTGKGSVGGLAGASWENTIVSDCYSTGEVNGNGAVGGLIGEVEESNIMNCYSTGSATAKGDSVGGLIGRISSHSDSSPFNITNCFSTGRASGKDYVGGLIGGAYSHSSLSTISICYATGGASGTNYIGGLIGIGDGYITNCYSRGPVNGKIFVGGLIGYNREYFRNCYSTGTVTGNEHVGGLLGYSRSNVGSCFWDVENSGIGVVNDYNFGARGKTTSQMQTLSTFTRVGWCFDSESIPGECVEDIWFMRDGIEYPRLFNLNRKSVANAGNDQVVYAFVDGYALVHLDGTASYDIDGDALEYYWFNDANELIATVVEPNVVLPVGEHVIDLIVNDGIEDSEPNSCMVTVIEAIETEAKLTPKSLNRKSNRPHVIGRLELAGYNAVDIDPNEPMVLMPGDIAAERMEILPGKNGAESTTLVGFFNHTAMMDAIDNMQNPLPPSGYSPLAGGELEVTIAAKLLTGQWVYGTDVVKIK